MVFPERKRNTISGQNTVIGIFSDIHGNTEALKTTLKVLEANGAETLICLGDTIGYLPSTDTIEILRSIPNMSIVIKGNHEQMILTGEDKAGNPLSPERLKIYNSKTICEKLTEQQQEYLNDLPLSHTEILPCGKALFVHGAPDDELYGYVYPDTDLSPWEDLDYDYIFMGHTHRPFIATHKNKTFINVGSCGMPRDHGSLGACALFDEHTGNARILRFSIAEETAGILEDEDSIHDSVIRLFERIPSTYTGEYIDV